MRFVPDENKSEIINDTLTRLQRINCDCNTDRQLPSGFKHGVYNAWEDAKEDI